MVFDFIANDMSDIMATDSSTHNPMPRKLRFSDIMILIGALGAAVIVDRQGTLGLYKLTPRQMSYEGSIVVAVDYQFQKLMPFIIIYTAAFTGIQIIQPGVKGRRVGERPGGVLCAIVCLAFTILFAWLEVAWKMGWHRGQALVFWHYVPYISLVVAASWSTLFVSGRWNPEPHWMDRMGRALGAVWLIPLLLVWLRQLYNV